MRTTHYIVLPLAAPNDEAVMMFKARIVRALIDSGVISEYSAGEIYASRRIDDDGDCSVCERISVS